MALLKPLVDKKVAWFVSANSDEEILEQYVQKKGMVFIRDKPAIQILQYRDYMIRKELTKTNERIHCPFAIAKRPIMKKKRGFIYPVGSNISKLFDSE